MNCPTTSRAAFALAGFCLDLVRLETASTNVEEYGEVLNAGRI